MNSNQLELRVAHMDCEHDADAIDVSWQGLQA